MKRTARSIIASTAAALFTSGVAACRAQPNSTPSTRHQVADEAARQAGSGGRPATSADGIAGEDGSGGTGGEDAAMRQSDGGMADSNSSASVEIDQSAGSCTGARTLRLGVLVDGQIARREAYSGVLYELGQPFLYVDNACGFWVSSWDGDDVLQEWLPMRTGTLLEGERVRLDALVAPNRLEALRTGCNVAPGGDFPAVVVSNGNSQVACSARAPAFEKHLADAQAIAKALYARGTDVGEALRVVVAADAPLPITDLPPHDWPVSDPIAGFVVAEPNAYEAGQSARVVDLDSLGKLRSLRSEFLEEQATKRPREVGIPIAGGFLLFMRDDVPFAAVDGLINLGREL